MGELPAGGLWMRQALRQILSKPWQDLLDQFEAFEARDPPDALRSILQGPWSEVIRMAIAGGVQIRGIPPGERSSIVLETSLLLASRPNLQKHTLETTAGTFSGILIVPPTKHSPEPPSAAVPRTEQKNKGGRPSVVDDAFIQELLRYANSQGVLLVRLKTSRHMKDWAAENYHDEVPSDETIERAVKRYWPPSLPMK